MSVACEQAPKWGLGRNEKSASGASRARSGEKFITYLVQAGQAQFNFNLFNTKQISHVNNKVFIPFYFNSRKLRLMILP